MANLTQKALIREFEAMLTDMPFGKITVSALIARCEVSSNTFYYHFHDIYDLLGSWIAVKRSAFLQERDAEEPWDVRLKAFFRTLKAHQAPMQHLFDDLSRERLERHVFEVSKPWFYNYLRTTTANQSIDEHTLQGLADCCCYAFYGLLLEFIRSNMTLDADAAVDRLQTIFSAVLGQTATTPQ